MPDLLLEFFSEDIPARMQARAAEDLRKLVTNRLAAAGLACEGARAFATPRRLTLAVHGVPARQPDAREERKGPRVGAPKAAIEGFLKDTGLRSISEAKIEKDAKRGDYYVALIEKPGRAAIEVIAEIVPEVMKSFPWPKSMRWGSGSLAWVRPLHAVVATFGSETEEPQIVPFSVDGIAAGDVTYGHRFMAPAPIKVRRFADYLAKLEQAKVVLDAARRAEIIRADAQNLAFAQGLELVADEELVAEVAGLVEWPVALMGSFDAEFLQIPDEVIRSTIRNNQKCFVLRAPRTARLANKFILVANIEAADGGKAIVVGCERVIRARLADAKFFYETDLRHWREISLEQRLEKFKTVVFHEKLGTQWQRIERIAHLARELAPVVKANPDKAERAALLCKADLLTEVVGEFPELQGVMGKYYAEALGEDEAIAHACEDHYKPQGPDDLVPAEPVSVAVALADKLDALVGFWAIDEKPTGSKDPYALRRAALGIIRLIVDNKLRIPFGSTDRSQLRGEKSALPLIDNLLDSQFDRMSHFLNVDCKTEDDRVVWRTKKTQDLISFFADRLKVQLRAQGARHDLVDAVLSLKGQNDFLMIVRRVEALGQFLDSEDGKNLLAGYKRATNIIRIEEKRDKRAYTGAPDRKLFRQAEEKALAAAIEEAKAEAEKAVAREDFAAAMEAMARLRPHVDTFFDKVTVNVADKPLRENRLKLLNQIREATCAVADFSKIEG